MSNVIPLFERKTIQGDLLSRLNSFRTRIIANGLEDDISVRAALAEMRGFAAEVADQVAQFQGRSDMVERLIGTVKDTDSRLLFKQQLKASRESVIAATLDLACELRQLTK